MVLLTNKIANYFWNLVHSKQFLWKRNNESKIKIPNTKFKSLLEKDNFQRNNFASLEFAYRSLRQGLFSHINIVTKKGDTKQLIGRQFWVNEKNRKFNAYK